MWQALEIASTFPMDLLIHPRRRFSHVFYFSPLGKPSDRTLSLSFCHYASGSVEKEWKWGNRTIFDVPSWYFDKSFELSLNSSPMLLWNTKIICVGWDKSHCNICFLSNCLPLNLNSSLCKEKIKWFVCPVVLGTSLYACSALACPD